MAYSRTDVCNLALGHLGDAPVFLTSVDIDTTKAAKVLLKFLDPARKSLLRRFPWNFAMVPYKSTLGTLTGAADNGAGLVRITKATHGFSTGNRVGISEVVGTTEANGEWTITVIDANNFDLVGSTFANTYVSGGYVSLAAAYGFRHKHPLPSDFLRFIKMEDDSEGVFYQVMAGGIFTDAPIIYFRYIADLWPTATTDYTNMDAVFYETLGYWLAWKACYAITGSNALKKQLMEDYRYELAKARFVDSTENPQKRVTADEWLEARLNSQGRGFVRDPMT